MKKITRDELDERSLKSQESYLRWLPYWLLLIACCVVCECGKEPAPPPSAATLTDATGIAVPIMPLPRRIISFAPFVTQNIYLLGAQDRLVAVTRLCKIPSGEAKPLIGDLLHQDIEQVIKLFPDLVLATKEGNSSQALLQLRKLGKRAFVLPETDSWAEIKQGFIQMAALLGKTGVAEQLLANYESRIAKLAIHNPKSEVRYFPKVFVQLSEQLHTAGKGTFIDEAIRYAGGLNIAQAALSRWPMLSIEEVIRQDPDLIIISTMGESAEQSRSIWGKFPMLKAVKSNKIHMIEADILCQPTPENFVRLVEIIAERLH